MKKLLFSLALLFTTTIGFSQNAPAGYDGGSELQNAIRKAKNKKPAQKTKSANKEKIIIVEKDVVLETPQEKLFREVNGYSHPDYVRRVTSTKAYADYVAETNRLEEERIRKYNEEAPKRRLDSIAKIEKLAQEELKRKEKILKLQKQQDSINKNTQKDRDAYIEKQKQEQRKNNRFRLFKRN